VGVGGAFNFLAGETRRAPLWMQRVGLEWAHRLISEPARLWRRYLIDDLPLAALLFLRQITGRNRRLPPRQETLALAGQEGRDAI
jgi:N-acetylglucosaminyldiphosphoundecaprenol N-acetyl-beta-D-mannosaminyltransferase